MKNSFKVLAALLGLSLAVAASAPAVATVCNGAGCWNGTVTYVKAQEDKVWFVVDDDANLDNLIVAGCTVKTIYLSGSKKALYLTIDDDLHREKMNLLTIALSTGQKIGFSAVDGDPQNSSYCELGYVYLEAP